MRHGAHGCVSIQKNVWTLQLHVDTKHSLFVPCTGIESQHRAFSFHGSTTEVCRCCRCVQPCQLKRVCSYIHSDSKRIFIPCNFRHAFNARQRYFVPGRKPMRYRMDDSGVSCMDPTLQPHSITVADIEHVPIYDCPSTREVLRDIVGGWHATAR